MASNDSSLDALQDTISVIFDQTQVTVANHRKNCVALFKAHTHAASVTKVINDGGSVKLVGERAFGDVFVDMLNRVLVVKKGPASAERSVRFISEYVKFMNEKGVSIRQSLLSLVSIKIFSIRTKG
jgi:condensin complex subunit 3